MSNKIEVTVGIPFYRFSDKKYLCSAIESILIQTLVPKEIHLIQDGTISQELQEVVNYYVAHYSHIKHILIPQNMGLAYAINISILNSSSDYYARMDSDDISCKERFSKQICFLEKNLDIDILGTQAFIFEDEYPSLDCLIRIMPTSPKEISDLFHYQCPLIHPSVMFRRSIFAKIGLYDLQFRDTCDLELWSRALKLKIGIANLSEPLLYYRFTGSITRRAEALKEQIKARYRFNTLSPKLNLLKIMSLIFRCLPHKIQVWGYKKFKKDVSFSHR